MPKNKGLQHPEYSFIHGPVSKPGPIMRKQPWGQMNIHCCWTIFYVAEVEVLFVSIVYYNHVIVLSTPMPKITSSIWELFHVPGYSYCTKAVTVRL